MAVRLQILTIILLGFLALSMEAKGQIHEPEGINMPGDWDSWTQPLSVNALASEPQEGGDVALRVMGTDHYHTVIKVASSGGDIIGGTHDWLFTSGPDDDYYSNKWGNVTVTMNTLQSYTHGSGVNDNSVTVSNGNWYAVNWQDQGYTNTNAIFMETSSAPVTLDNISYTPNTDIKPWDKVTVTLTTSSAPCAEENIFLRYTTDGYSTSTLVKFDFSSNTGTAEIPPFDAGTSVSFYAYSTTLASGDIGSNHDMVTINYINNSGSNYDYTVITPTTYTTTQNGNFSTPDTWDGGSVPPSGNALSIDHDLTLDQDYTAASVTINSGGHLIFDGTRSLTVEGNGDWTNNGSFTADNGTVIFQAEVTAGGASDSDYNNVTIAGLNVHFDYTKSRISGMLKITTGSIANAPELLTGSTLRYEQGGNYTRVTEWNSPYHVEIGNNTTLNLNIDAFGGDLTVLGNLTVESGSAADMGSGSYKLIINGNLNLDGTLALSTASGGDLTISGNWNRTGTFTPNDRLVLFNGSSTLTGHTTFDYITVANGASLTLNNDITANEAFVVESNATLDMGAKIIDGTGSFETKSGATLKIGHLSGIAASDATGNIQNTSTIRKFVDDATYHYTGNGNQYSGEGLPTTSAAKTIIVELANNTDEFRINTGSSVGIAAGGKLQIISGKLIEADAVGNGRHIDGDGNLEMTGGKYFFERDMATNVPRLSGTYSITGGQIVLGAAGDQTLQGGEAYYDLVFEGSGTATTSSSITDVNSVTISGSKTVDVGSSALGGTGTNLTMTGGALRISKVGGTQPMMTGTYNLTGGSIEFYGTSDTQNQSIRDGINYHNITINASAANLIDGNVSVYDGGNLSVAGTFLVNAPACLKLSTTINSYIDGAGTFDLQSGAALRFGNDITSGTTAGNIRTTTKNLSSNATYILYGKTNQTLKGPFPAATKNLTDEKSGGNLYLEQDLEITDNLNLNGGIIDATGYTITVSNNATTAISGESSSSYIVGILIRAIAQTKKSNKGTVYKFPIGTPTSYNPATVDFTTLPSSPGTVTAEFITTLDPNYENGLPMTDPDGSQKIDHLSDHGYWKLIPVSIAGYTYNLTIQGGNFTDDPEFEITNSDGLRLLVRDDFSNPWQFLGSHSTGAAAPPSVSRTGITKFGVVAMGGLHSENPLPVEFLNFKGTSGTNNITLTWSTASEFNNDFFTVYHSNDGINYNPVGRVQGAGNSTQIHQYTFTDHKPAIGTNYYYLEQTDFDGTKTQSQIVSVSLTDDHNWHFNMQYQTLHVVPSSLSSQKITYRILNLNGQILSSGAYNYQRGETMTFHLPRTPVIIQFVTQKGKSINKKIINKNN